MKKYFLNKVIVGMMAVIIMTTVSCQNILEETPRGSITTASLQSNQGVELALISVYAHLRLMYGDLGCFYDWELGTDECTTANLVNSGATEEKQDLYQINPSTGAGRLFANTTFAYINTCNAIISIGEENGVSSKLLAEARVLRAFDYFQMTQMYGGVPLDLGSGNLAFNTLPTRTSVRNSVPEVYAAIFADLEKAETDLNGVTRNSRVIGGVTQAFAQYLLAKAYLTYGWWIEKNPGKATETAATYYQKAYDKAVTLINNSGVGTAGANGFGLLQNYHDVNLAQNDRNMECLLFADRAFEAGYTFNGGSGWANGVPPENSAFLAMRMWFDSPVSAGASTSVQRATTQDTGRPWRRVMPTREVIFNIFADKTNDMRYFGTFQEVWKANDQNQVAKSKGVLGNPFQVGDTVFYLPATDIVTSPPTKSATDAVPWQKIPGKNYAVLCPEYFNREYYPSLWKLGPYRSDLASPLMENNGPSLRPYNIAKLSEAWLIAAEAAVKGANPQAGKSARDLINVLRKRAAYSTNKSAADIASAEAAMIAATPATIDINYILDERMRELYGEGYRWFDLVRTKKLSRAATCTIRNFDANTVQPVRTITRPLAGIADDSKYYLKPIPQGFIDALDMSPDEKKAYQNPGY